MKYVVGMVLGVIIGLPVGLNSVNLFAVASLPHSTVFLIITLGMIGGITGGLCLLHSPSKVCVRSLQSIEKFVDLYSLTTVCAFSMGIPVFTKFGVTDVYAASLLSGYFFLAFGIGLVLAGVGKLMWKNTRSR